MANEARQIIVRLNGEEVQRLLLTAPVVTIGRTPDNTLALANLLVSRRHAELRLTPAGIVLTDVGSRSGTVVNGVALLANQPALLTPGAMVQIGPFTLLYQTVVSAQSDEIPAAVATPASAPPLGVPPVAVARPRRAQPPLRPEGDISRYVYELPVIYHDNLFLGKFLQIFESIWEPLEQRQDAIHMYFNPRTCPAPLLGWLAGWLEMPLNEHWPEERKRALLAEAMDLARWRGTRYGLTRMLEICTGAAVEVTDEPGQPFVIRVRVGAPPEEAERQGTFAALVEQLVRTHKPAHVGYILEILQPQRAEPIVSITS
ncbi:MAG: hypothetical protein RLZZ387_5044 [Chloroflexota bacterium]|jgi:phage tail-like protein